MILLKCMLLQIYAIRVTPTALQCIKHHGTYFHLKWSLSIAVFSNKEIALKYEWIQLNVILVWPSCLTPPPPPQKRRKKTHKIWMLSAAFLSILASCETTSFTIVISIIVYFFLWRVNLIRAEVKNDLFFLKYGCVIIFPPFVFGVWDVLVYLYTRREIAVYMVKTFVKLIYLIACTVFFIIFFSILKNKKAELKRIYVTCSEWGCGTLSIGMVLFFMNTHRKETKWSSRMT